MTEKKTLNEKTTSLPNKIPVGKEQLERAINLLGDRVKSDLQTKARQELVELVGAYPSIEQAAIWKNNLS
jgi:F0F1-type ATP synthase beta subunit